jgi:hypothetical protein
MRRSLALSSGVLTLALAPAVLFAQTPSQPPSQQPPAGQTPTGQTPTGQPATPAQPAAPKLAFKSTAGILLIQVKPDQTAAFEEMIAKLKTGLASSQDPTLKQQASLKVYKSAEAGAGGNALYVLVADPALPNTEYSFLDVINKTLTPEQQRDPATRELYTKWAGSLAGMNILNLTPIAATQ